MKSSSDLRQLLLSIDRKSYPAYKTLKGIYDFSTFSLSIDHVQGDPFASPSKLSIHVDGEKANLPKELYSQKVERVAAQDYLLRQFYEAVEPYNRKAKGSGKSGVIWVTSCGQEILERTDCSIDQNTGRITVRLEIGFPANGRTISARELEKILFSYLPGCVTSSLYYANLNQKALGNAVNLSKKQQFIREELKKRSLCAFIKNGAILPRKAGNSDLPMKDAIPFLSPDSMAVSMTLPDGEQVEGMGIPKGITLIVGGGYHGKSTLLKSLETGVYNHILGDGREFVLTCVDGIKLRAEDSRSIGNVDISLFINHLPGGRSTKHFSTDDASGSTSQAANIIEGIESGASLFLIDEDTTATNFMVRDELMQKVINPSDEPITPFSQRVSWLYQELGISTILVAGSFGTYFHLADHIIQMKEYLPYDITKTAKEEASAYPTVDTPVPAATVPNFGRHPKSKPSHSDREDGKVKLLGKDRICLNREEIDLRYVEQLIAPEQYQALGYLLSFTKKHLSNGNLSMKEIADQLEARLEEKGLESFTEMDYLPAALARPRRHEISACINRCRSLLFS